jgi:hypothetical protein
MSLRPDFLAKLEKQSDEELLGMLAEAHGYVPEAIEAVRVELSRRGVDPNQVPHTPPPLSAERPPKLPKIWIGFLLAFAFLVAEIVEAAQGNDTELGMLTVLSALGAWIYWLFCVSRFHDVANALAGTLYPISAHTAVIRHFFPFYNLYWIFKWPIEMEKYLRANTSVRMMSGVWLGIGFFSSLLLRAIDGFLGYCVLFGFSAYLAAKLRRAVQERVVQKERIAEVFS